MKCKCPKCEKVHSRAEWWFNWQGRGIPRRYCHNCERDIKLFFQTDIAMKLGEFIDRRHQWQTYVTL